MNTLNYEILNQAGFTNAELNIREQKYLIPELRKLGYTFAWMVNAGFTDEDFIFNGYIKSVYGAGWVKAKNPLNKVWGNTNESTWQ